uniref:Pepsin inhibitor-3-like repeated domain-containing protein n=1 Tax=Panagrolaimus sp. ES5 TaxID=591445 RepID=A0AC34GTV1_9BILA
MRIAVLIGFIFVSVVDAARYHVFNNKPRVGTESACLVTANLLYAHGNFIREITPSEQAELVKYEQELDAYNKQLADFLHTAYISHPPAINWIYGSRVVLPRLQQAMPRRPTSPSFCAGRDTVVYKLNGCMVQNYRIFIGQLYVRSLTDEEKREMDEYEYHLKEYQNEVVESLKKSSSASIPTGWDSFPENFKHWDETEEILEEEIAIISSPSTTEPAPTTTTRTTKKVVVPPKVAITIERPKTNILPPAAPKFCSQLF